MLSSRPCPAAQGRPRSTPGLVLDGSPGHHDFSSPKQQPGSRFDLVSVVSKPCPTHHPYVGSTCGAFGGGFDPPPQTHTYPRLPLVGFKYCPYARACQEGRVPSRVYIGRPLTRTAFGWFSSRLSRSVMPEELKMGLLDVLRKAGVKQPA